MKKIYYKAILRDRTSAIIHNPLVAVKYLANEWTYPKIPNSKLMVFKDKSVAFSFIGGKWNGNDSMERMVVPCYIKNPINAGTYNMKARYPIIDATLINLDNFVDNLTDNLTNNLTDNLTNFWGDIIIKDKREKLVLDIYSGSDTKKWGSFCLFDFPPEGTILCDAVYCLE